MLGYILRYFSVVVALAIFSAHADVSVSREFQTHPINQAVDVGAGQYWVWSFPKGARGDTFRVLVDAENELWKDISAFVVDDQGLVQFKAGAQFRAVGRSKEKTPFEFSGTRIGAEQLYLVIDNRYSLLTTKKARISVTLTNQLTEEKARVFERFLGELYSGIKGILILPDFELRMLPCNDVNAMSERDTGNITLCSEFLSMYMDKPNVITWIFLHELGHSALSLWGIPGDDNEDLADEFATAILLRAKNGSRNVMKAMDFFKGKNPNIEAQNVIQYGDRHSLSVQRMRNVHAWLLEPVRLTAKWNNLLYPHMTEGALKSIVAKPGPYDNVQLAREQLEKRVPSESMKDTSEPIQSVVFGCAKDTDCKGNRECEGGYCVEPKFR